MKPTTYTARERETTSIPIHDVLDGGVISIFPEVQSKGFFDIRLRGDQLFLSAGKFVGLIPLNEKVLIYVEPKIPVGNLLTLLSRTEGDLATLSILARRYGASTVLPPSLLEIMAAAFLQDLAHVEIEGLHKDYFEIEENGSAIKGSIQFQTSSQRYWSKGTRHAATYVYHDQLSDTRENRILRFACHHLLTNHETFDLKDKTVSKLKHYEDLFSACGVSLVRPESTRFEISKAISPAYRQCVRLARTILERQGVELSGDGEDVTLPSIVIDMEILFEQYIRRVIQKQLKSLAVHDGNKEGARPLFDNRSNPPANPDVVIEENSACVMIGEVKYKLAESRDDINQVLAYAVTYRSSKIVLFLPADNRERSGLYEIGRVNGINVYRYRIDLASSDLDNEEREMGAALKTLIAT